MSESLQLHGLQHTRLPCPSPTPGAYSNSHPSSQWCHPTISSSVVPFSSHLQSFPASGSMSQFFTSGGQSIGVSASASILPMDIQDWFPLRLTGWISLRSKDLSRDFSNTTVWKHKFTSTQLYLWSGSYIHTPTRLLGPWDFPGKNSGVDCHFLLQGIFLMRDLPDPGIKPSNHVSCIAGSLLYCRWKESPYWQTNWETNSNH